MGYLLEISNLNKYFGATKALENVCFKIEFGEIHALLGENGAGKSTLIKILSGALFRDSGEISFLGKNYAPNSVKEAISSGVSTAFQEFSLLPNLTVAENLLLPFSPLNKLHLISKKHAVKLSENILKKFASTDIKAQQKIASLSIAQKQRIETIKALVRKPRLLILDEPTAALYDPEWLYKHVEAFLDNGNRGVLFITHRLRESRRLCNNFTVLQNGRHVETSQFDSKTDKKIFKLMTGKKSFENELNERHIDLKKVSEQKILRVKDLRFDKKNLSGSGVSITIGKGEIYGIAGLEGQGQRELFSMIGGTKKITGGIIEINGKRVTVKNPKTAAKFGIVQVPEERKIDGIFPGVKTTHHLSIRIIKKIKNRFGIISMATELDNIKSGSNEVDLDKKNYNKPIESLSGGNQQKVILASALISGAKCLLLYDPTRGVDIGTKQKIYRVIQDFADKGNAVLFYSSELPEIVGLANRCGVFYQQKIFQEIEMKDLSEDGIIEAMHGYRDDKREKDDDTKTL